MLTKGKTPVPTRVKEESEPQTGSDVGRNSVQKDHEMGRQTPAFLPRTNVYMNEQKIYLESELTGVDKDSLDIHLKDNLLLIRGECKRRDREGYKLHYAEFQTGSFERSFKIEGPIDSDKIEAKIKNGVLKLEISFKEPLVRKVKVKKEND